jgi:GT2 family glycosyltransferase
MIVKNLYVKVNVLILLMEAEIEVTVNAVETLVSQLEEDVIVSILLNGGHSTYLRELFGSEPRIRYYESSENLGVAGGRNFLLGTTKCSDCDIVMILDNDVVPPVDYVRNLAEFLLDNEDSGVVGAVAADINNAGYPLEQFYGTTGPWQNKIFNLKSSDIKTITLQSLEPHKIFHMGSNEDVMFTYFSMRSSWSRIGNKLAAVFGLQPFRMAELRKCRRHLHLMQSGARKYLVSNVAGCSQAFRRSLVDEIGKMNNLFNPYGYEDADFCLRALRAGYRNYIDLNTWIYHGTDERHATRVAYRDANKRAQNVFRGRTILAGLHFKGFWKPRSAVFSVMLGHLMIEILSGRDPGISGMIRGYRDGRAILDNADNSHG